VQRELDSPFGAACILALAGRYALTPGVILEAGAADLINGSAATRHLPRLVRCQSILQRPPEVLIQTSRLAGVPRVWW
jgi:hypothetical protein